MPNLEEVIVLASNVAGRLLFSTAIALLSATGASAGRCSTVESAEYDAAWDRVYEGMNWELAQPGLLRDQGFMRLEPLSADVHFKGPEGSESAFSAIAAMLRTASPRLRDMNVRASEDWQIRITLYDSVAPFESEYVDPLTGERKTSTSPAWKTCEETGNLCDIAILRAGWQVPEIELRHITAHEFFHLVQHITVPRISDCKNLWWKEGTADWFANWVVPGSEWSKGWLRRFNYLSNEKPLTHLSYDAQAFFFWAADRYGPAYPLSLADFGDFGLWNPGRVASHLPPEDWQSFLETFLRGDLRYPDGRRAIPKPYLGELLAEPYRLEAPPLAFARARLDLPAGQGDLVASGNAPYLNAHRDADWVAYPLGPATIDYFVSCTEKAQLPIAAVSLDGEPLRLTVADEREETPCRCQGGVPPGHCLIGVWEAVSTDAPERYRRIAAPESDWTEQDMGENRFTFGPDGTFQQRFSRPARSRFRHEMGDLGAMHQTVTITNVAAGRWSAAGPGRVEICKDHFEGEMTNRIRVADQTQSTTTAIPYDPTAEEQGFEYEYACSGDRGEVKLLLDGRPFIAWKIRRAAPIRPPVTH